MLEFARTPRKRIKIGLVPMVDIAVFLLIFFMLTGSIEKFDIIPIDPPVAQAGKLMDEGHVTILLGAYEEIILDDEIVSVAKMGEVLAEQLAGNPNKVITLKADATVPANRVIDVMDAVRKAGGKNLSLVTQSKVPLYGE